MVTMMIVVMVVMLVMEVVVNMMVMVDRTGQAKLPFKLDFSFCILKRVLDHFETA